MVHIVRSDNFDYLAFELASEIYEKVDGEYQDITLEHVLQKIADAKKK